MELKDLETVKMIAETVIVLGSIGIGAWKTTRAIGKVADTVSSVPALKTQVETLSGSVEGIQRELKPNGGSSIRDSLNRIEATGKATAGRLDAHIERTRGGTSNG